ncbi:uncharacterized protein Tco025E_10250, partial [Trypanosoma conorhini]
SKHARPHVVLSGQLVTLRLAPVCPAHPFSCFLPGTAPQSSPTRRRVHNLRCGSSPSSAPNTRLPPPHRRLPRRIPPATAVCPLFSCLYRLFFSLPQLRLRCFPRSCKGRPGPQPRGTRDAVPPCDGPSAPASAHPAPTRLHTKPVRRQLEDALEQRRVRDVLAASRTNSRIGTLR